ncbi:hypothetical protein [Streptomyces goshikiensis]|uniref:hypothetical protein n=1 Tax=Streptomyces goshikiensis TaxID=1942 RepID=UPI0036C48B1D
MSFADANSILSNDTPDDLQEQLAALHRRLHLSNIRVQRLRAETFEDPPLEVESIVIYGSPCEVLVQPQRFAARFTHTVTLRDSGEQALAEVEIAIVVEYAMDEGAQPSHEVVSVYVERNAYFIAHPYLRETLQNATLKLGLEPVVLGVLSRDQPRPTEVTFVRRVAPTPSISSP